MDVFLEGLPQILQKSLFCTVTGLLEDPKEKHWITGVAVSQNGEGKGVKVFIPYGAPPKIAETLKDKWDDLLLQEKPPEGGHEWDGVKEQQKKPPPIEKHKQRCFRSPRARR